MSDNKFLTGKTALVTCSSRGVGYGIASGLAAAGASLILCSRDLPNGSLREACERIGNENRTNACSIACDLKTEAGLDSLLAFVMSETRGRGIDILVSNSPHPTNPRTPHGVDRTKLAESLFSVLSVPLVLSNTFAPLMAEREWGKIFFVSSCYAAHPTHRFFMSSFLRPALNNLSTLIAQEHGARRVKALTLLLGYFGTSLTSQIPHDDPALSLAKSLAPIPGELPDSRHLGTLVADFCKDHFGLVGGSSLLVDYGYTAATP